MQDDIEWILWLHYFLSLIVFLSGYKVSEITVLVEKQILSSSEISVNNVKRMIS